MSEGGDPRMGCGMTRNDLTRWLRQPDDALLYRSDIGQRVVFPMTAADWSSSFLITWLQEAETFRRIERMGVTMLRPCTSFQILCDNLLTQYPLLIVEILRQAQADMWTEAHIQALLQIALQGCVLHEECARVPQGIPSNLLVQYGQMVEKFLAINDISLAMCVRLLCSSARA